MDYVLTIKHPQSLGRFTGDLWGPLNKTVISGGEDGILRIWDTEVVNECLNPVRNQTFDFVVEDGLHDMLILELYDHDTFGKANTDREIEFEFALQKLIGESTDISQEVEDIKEFTKVLNSLPQGNILELFQKRYLRAVIVRVGLMAFLQFGGINDVCLYTSSIFVSAVSHHVELEL